MDSVTRWLAKARCLVLGHRWFPWHLNEYRVFTGEVKKVHYGYLCERCNKSIHYVFDETATGHRVPIPRWPWE